MTTDFDSLQIVDRLMDALADTPADQLLTQLAETEPLPDEDDPAWDDDQFWIDAALPFDALARVACTRKLLEAVPLILDKMCYGDPGETMRPVCHGFEYIVNPDWEKLFPHYSKATESARRGTRLWSLFCLARLRSEQARPIFERCLTDSDDQVRCEAERGLRMLDNTAS